VRAAALLVAALLAESASAGGADVVAARVFCDAPPRCRFDVTIRHTDEGWHHYADRFEVLAPDGDVIATRTLRHPHVREQPFTRTLKDVEIPPGLTMVRLRAHDSHHGHTGTPLDLPLPDPAPN